MKNKLLIFCFVFCNLFVKAQINVDNFLGNYNCTLIQWHGTLYVNYNRIISVNLGIDSVHFFGDDSGTTSFQSAEFLLNNDSTFYHILNPTVRYGYFYNNDSIYVRMNSIGGYYDEYYGKKIITDINELNLNDNLKIYPNPVSSILTIELTNTNLWYKQSRVTIKNSLGQVIKTEELNNKQQQMDVGKLPNGIYFIEVTTAKGILSKKIIVSN